MSTPQVAVVVDSTVSMPQPLLDEHGIIIIPMELTLEGRTYRDGVDLQPEEFYRLLPTLQGVPKTSAPRPASFLEAFQTAGEKANHVLCLTLASRLSSTYDVARVAAERARDLLPHLSIRVMDTRTAGGAEALVALAAARAAQVGKGLEEVVAITERVCQRVQFMGILETLYYAWKGGRIPKVALWTASFLRIKPILDISDGEVRLLARPRTREGAIQRLLELIRARMNGRPLHVNILHAQVPEEAEGLKQLLTENFPCVQLFTSVFTPVIGAHTGPGLLGVAFYEDAAAPASSGP